MLRAKRNRTAIPAFNIPYLPVIEPTVRALRDTRCFGQIAVARLEWTKFSAQSPRAVYEEYGREKDERFTRLHMDHVPVVDEDARRVDYAADIGEAVALGYDSVMVDASRLPLEENIACTKEVVEMAHAKGIAVEGELGAILGHDAGGLPPYEELFASGKGFTDPGEAERFVAETGVDWLSVAVGSFHGAIAPDDRVKKKLQARLNIEWLEGLHQRLGIPLVLHGGTGIKKADLLDGVAHGITKINIATATRQPYEALMATSIAEAQEAVYEAAKQVIVEELELADSVDVLMPEA